MLASAAQAGQHAKMSTIRTMAAGLAPIVDFVFPPRCPSCGGAVARQGGLCPDCWEDLAIPSDPCCAACQRPFGSTGVQQGSLCAPCMAARPVHDGIAAATIYTETSRKLVLALKHGGRIGLAPMLARMIAARMLEPDRARLIVPVPLHRWRLWQRGYNQAALLGGELAKLGHGRMLVDLLQRTKPTPSLGGLGRKARARALSGAIALARRRGDIVRGVEVILVDDVLTSGATSDACVKVLKQAGATRVVIACFARVLDEARSPAP